MKYGIFFLIFQLLLLSCRKPEEPAVTEVLDNQLQDFRYLNELVGERPDAVSLWDTEPLQSELRKLPGLRFEAFVRQMASAKALKRDRVLYTIAALPDSAINGYVVALFDTLQTRAEVLYLKQDTVIVFPQDSAALFWPDEVKNLMFNFQQWEVYEGNLPCADCQEIATLLAIDTADENSRPEYFLEQMYVDSLKGNSTFQQRGVSLLLYGQAEENTRTMYQISDSISGQNLNFLKLGEDQLELLDSSLKRIATDHNLILDKIK